MNIFQKIINFFLSLFKGGASNQPKVTSSTAKPISNPKPPKPKPKPVPKPPKVEEPVVEKKKEEVVAVSKKALEIKEEESGGKRSVQVSDGVLSGKFKELKQGSWKGLYTGGKLKVIDFINGNKAMLERLNMTESAINVMRAVAENEGNLEAINAYDGAFLSFGIFQWTLGTGTNKGELPALLKKLKTNFPATFEKHFGQFGLDIDSSTNTTYGYITLDGARVESKAQKQQFRSAEWVYRFWRAGHDKEVQATQIEHALSRLKNFYWRWKVQGIPLNELLTSEYAVGLILDNHVNLPYLVKLSLQQAMEKTGLGNPSTWNGTEEADLIEAYIKERAVSQSYTRNGQAKSLPPMHNANKRAATTRKYVDQGIISDTRGSFQYSDVISRSADGFVVEAPSDFFQEDYPEIEDGIGLDPNL